MSFDLSRKFQPPMPEAHFLSTIDWQVFGTLTFVDEVAAPRRKKMAFALLRKLAKCGGIHFGQLLWCLREEGGARDGSVLPHIHFLAAGIPTQVVEERWCLQLQKAWRQMCGGVSQIKPYVHALNGVEYVLKRSGEDFGGDEFVYNHPEKLTISNSLFLR